ncbi:phage/plasmid primase, P4 family [Roseovarius nanhaiticus]|uniref:phage/plasmid primase, P4 family n=1 Tax=Roseovarius nanhaiticus TaxID=573024 RepID=UPI002492E15F|nr:phage/plasmid primase, P4 family [Roseovarius nanhaiticus]
MMVQQSLQSIALAAQEYAARGWHVFPAPIGQKRSHKSAEYSNGRAWGATTDTAEIAQDWQRWPNANVGIVTGPKSGFFVIEADTLKGHGVDGISTLVALIEEHGPLTATIEALSPSGSWHLYFKWPDGVSISNSEGRIAPGVDVRGDGGMVIGVPSVKDGAGQAYQWKNPPSLFELADCPEWLMKLCLKPAPKLPERATPEELQIATGGNGWADAALRGEIANVLSAPVGKRNGSLNTAAFSLGQIVAGGALAEGFVRERLTAAADAIGLEPAEIAKTIKSGLEAGFSEPRKPSVKQSKFTGNCAPWREDQDPDLSHDALASDLGAKSWDENARHVAKWGKWFFWSGTRWEVDDRLEHMTRTRLYLRTRANDLTTWMNGKADQIGAAEDEERADKLRRWVREQSRILRSKNTVAAVEALARANKNSVARADDFDNDKMLLGTPGGTVDLRTGQMRRAERSDMITKLTACAPAPGTPTRWITFLHEIFDGDAELIAFMQRAAGYALTGNTNEHKLLFLYGGGRNGKSVFLNALFDIMGDYSRRSAAETFLHTVGDKHGTGIAGLQGARLVVGSELPKGKTWDEAVVKDLTGGEKLTGRFMRGDFFDFDPQMTLMIAGNNMPSFRGVDEAIRARVVLVPFNVTIPPENRDRDLGDKLRAEAPQILQWAIEGALQWLARGLDVPARVAKASHSYFDDEDTIGQFIGDEIVQEIGAFTSAADLHMRFTQWGDIQGLNSWTQRTLVKELKARGFSDSKGTGGVRGLRGLRLK